MKNVTLCLLFVFTVLYSTSACAQDTAIWTADINAFPDSTSVSPVKLKLDKNNNSIALSTYYNSTANPRVSEVYVTKHNSDGVLQWQYIYDHSGKNQPRGYDMVLDGQNAIYICGRFHDSANNRSFVIKLNTDGQEVWKKDTLLAAYEQMTYFDNKVYLGKNGVALIDSSGKEIWKNKSIGGEGMIIDSKGQIIIVGYNFSGNTISRYDSLGNKNLDFGNIRGNRLALDQSNNLYILSESGRYRLTKFDSSGSLKWDIKNLPTAPPFGDIGYEVLTDHDNNVLLVGLSDSIFKLDPAGNLIWKRSMDGLDSYLISAQITGNNLLAVAGSVFINKHYATKVMIFNLDGKTNWSGFYQDTFSSQEFLVDLAIDNSGVYAIENNNQRSRLMKFAPVWNKPIDYSQICVKRIYQSSSQPVLYTVEIFNGSLGSMSYPYVQIIAPNGDTVFNKKKTFNFFLQTPNSVYGFEDSITGPVINDFTNHKFYFHHSFPDTSVQISFCNSSRIMFQKQNNTLFKVYPNPFHSNLTIEFNADYSGNGLFALYDVNGKLILRKTLDKSELLHIDQTLTKGLYFYLYSDANGLSQSGKLLYE